MEMAATATAEKKETPKKEVKTEVDEQIEVFEPVAKAVDRVLTHPETGEQKTFVQHELSFLPKLKFIRLLSGTLRMSSTDEQGGIGVFISEAIAGLQSQNQQEMASEFLTTILALAELAPDFMEEAIILALSVKPEDQAWAIEAIQNLDDNQGLDIVEVFIAQNGASLRDFFTKRLSKIGARLNQELAVEEQQESENTT